MTYLSKFKPKISNIRYLTFSDKIEHISFISFIQSIFYLKNSIAIKAFQFLNIDIFSMNKTIFNNIFELPIIFGKMLNPFPHLPHQIRNYKLTSLIGGGGFAAVYKATNIHYNMEFAVKVVCPKQDSQSRINRSFDAEVRALLKLDHPNVIRMYDFFREGEYMFLVLEYCAGGTLEDRITNNDFASLFTLPSQAPSTGYSNNAIPNSNSNNGYPPIGHSSNYNATSINSLKILNNYINSEKNSEESKIKICHQIISALQYCYDNNIAHRDIKASNVLFDSAGRAKVADFGLSELIGHDDNLSEFDGSLFYAAPEIYKKVSFNPFKSDVWALGVLFYRLFSREFPFMGESKSQLKKQIVIGYYNQNLPTTIGSIIKKMLVVEPEKRTTICDLSKMDFFKSYNTTSILRNPCKLTSSIRYLSIGSKLRRNSNDGRVGSLTPDVRAKMSDQSMLTVKTLLKPPFLSTRK
ncbi:hypothetical protein TRFO_03928 [Tritrichomonas foetus]|uniref:Protein kinase domain-containing protein n=1 Tax=Tritrichomonas foetus TaxID=1144522 RepID=A0A1J4KPQ6_9EUKA|nr:hypothetical protein TRFO_03928 [Tritrichomonas foetus]|eukprot:OHT11686.1 hypothetical protein TRFO_03928 [Tritrichomonas foetus]